MVNRMRTRSLIICLLVCLSYESIAQDVEPFYKTPKEKWGWFFNPGVSLGFAGSRAFNAVPHLTLKMGKFYFSGMYIPGDRTKLYSMEAAMEFYHFNGTGGRTHTLGFSSGFSSTQREPDFFRAYQGFNLMLNYGNYRAGSRGRFNFQAGLLWNQQENGATGQFEKQEIIPWLGLSMNLYSFKLPEYRDPPDRDSITLLPRIYKSNAFFARGFNPSIGVGIGTGYGGTMGYAFGMNIASTYLKIGQTFNVNPAPIARATSIQVGLNFYRFRIHPDFATYGTISSDFTVQKYNCGSYETPEWCNDNYSRGSVLAGLNGYMYDSRFSWSMKVGVGWRNGISEVQNFEGERIVYPAAELGLQLHLFKFRRIAYGGKLVWEKGSGAQNPEKVEVYGDSLELPEVFNLFVSIGGGTNHPWFFGPTVGVQFWRLFISTGILPFDGYRGTSITGDIEAGYFNMRTALILGMSHNTWDSNKKLTSVHLGTNYRWGQRTKLNIKAGLGLYTIGFQEEWIPVGSISYQIYLLKFDPNS